jgi:putative intracellular protease/amidase
MSVSQLRRPDAVGETRHQPEPGRNHPLGATPDDDGVNFAIFSEHATGIELLIFERAGDTDPVQTVTLDPDHNRSFAVWHVYLRGLRAPAFYALRVFGPEGDDARAQGRRFDPGKALADPYARGLDRALWDRGAAYRPGRAFAEPRIVKGIICHGLWLLARVPELVRGRSLTCHPNLYGDALNMGADYVDADVVVDDDLVTGRTGAQAGLFARTVIEQIHARAAVPAGVS